MASLGHAVEIIALAECLVRFFRALGVRAVQGFEVEVAQKVKEPLWAPRLY